MLQEYHCNKNRSVHFQRNGANIRSIRWRQRNTRYNEWCLSQAKPQRTPPNPIYSVIFLTNINAILTRSQIHTNPLMSLLHSIYPNAPQGYSIPSYTHSQRPFITWILLRDQCHSFLSTIPSHTRAHPTLMSSLPASDSAPGGKLAERRSCDGLGARRRFSRPNEQAANPFPETVGSVGRSDWRERAELWRAMFIKWWS